MYLSFQLSPATYRASFTTSVEDISYTCLICSQAVPFTQKSMEIHLKKDHNLNLNNYEQVLIIKGYVRLCWIR
jgi:hypothetical protein